MRTQDIVPMGMWTNAVEGCSISSERIVKAIRKVQHQLELTDNARTQRSVELLAASLAKLLEEVHKSPGKGTPEDARLAILGYFTSQLLHDVEEYIEKRWPRPDYW